MQYSVTQRDLCIFLLAWSISSMVFILIMNRYYAVNPLGGWTALESSVIDLPPIPLSQPSMCRVDCRVGVPCEYNDEVDFRIIVMTYNRPQSLQNSLEAISLVDTMGKQVAVEIWIDRSSGPAGEIDHETVNTATQFNASWTVGRVCIHQRERNAYIDGQWIDTWRPKPWSKEIGLILEDDVDISRHTLRWLEAVHARYDHMQDVAGYTLQMEGTRFFRGKRGHLKGPHTDNVFLYSVLGTWGFSPRAQNWRRFQDWFHTKDPRVKPYVPDILPTNWYKTLETRGTERSMWSIWHIYYSYINNYFTVYCNLHVKYERSDMLLSSNRKEKGLHFDGSDKKGTTKNWNLLLSEWKPEYSEFPENETRYTYEGNLIHRI